MRKLGLILTSAATLAGAAAVAVPPQSHTVVLDLLWWIRRFAEILNLG